MRFVSQLDFNAYLRATLTIALSSWWKVALYVALIVFSFFNMHILLYKLLFAGCTILIPAVFFYLVWRNFRKNPLIGEKLQFELDESRLFIQGETFELTRPWNQVYKISQTSRFYFFWITKRLAIPVIATEITSEKREIIQQILNANTSVRNDLTRDEN